MMSFIYCKKWKGRNRKGEGREGETAEGKTLGVFRGPVKEEDDW